MNKLSQGMAALVLVTSLGLVMPSAFGGSASADPKPGSGRTEDPRWFYCDLNRDGNYYEDPYHVVSQGNDMGSFHVIDNSSIILTALYDQSSERNFPLPVDPSRYVDINYPIRYYNNNHNDNKNQKGGPNAPVVACHEGPLIPTADSPYAPFSYDEGLITACDPTVCDPGPLVPGARYHVYESRTWYVRVSGNGAASGAGKHQHHSGHHRH